MTRLPAIPRTRAAGVLAMLAVAWLAVLDPRADLALFALAAVAVGAAGATYDIVIDAYRIETLKPEQLGVGSGMSQYGWRIGSVAAGSLALYVAARHGWTLAYLLCVALTWRLARRLAPGQEAAAAVIFASMLLPFGAAQLVTTDFLLAAFETLALWAFVEARFGGRPIGLLRLSRGNLLELYTTADREVTVGADTYLPLAITRSAIRDSVERQKSVVTLTLPVDAPCAAWWTT